MPPYAFARWEEPLPMHTNSETNKHKNDDGDFAMKTIEQKSNGNILLEIIMSKIFSLYLSISFYTQRIW